ncbi:MAG: hypothetical protein JJU19_16555 [Pararhodobacter sp.]|nr:hypothetical protein [Pararhodobacter sp.]
MNKPKVNAYFAGALARALLTAGLVMLPALIVPATPPELAQLMVLLALFAGGIVFAEYSSDYPGIIEFRFAAPFNRTRFMLIALMVLALSMLMRGDAVSGWHSTLVHTIAASCAQFLDFSFSPVRLLVAALPDNLSTAHLLAVHEAASLAIVLGVTTVMGFVLAIRLNLWPMGSGPFNVWINLPTFDPTAGNDVVHRLVRSARINIALGIVLPFLLPALVKASSLLVQPITLESPVGFVWGITLWAFVPVSLMMRGVAMIRVARMIRANRRLFADSEGNAFVTA